MPLYPPLTKYDDVYVRDYVGDDGGTQFVWWSQSPDIIPFQGDQLTWPQIINTYDDNVPDLEKPILFPGLNNIYVRAKNLGPNATTGATVKLYNTPFSLAMFPSQWLNRGVPTPSGSYVAGLRNQAGSATLEPNQIGATIPAFLLSPTSSQGHCYVAVVNTPRHPVQIPETFSSTAAFIEWVQSNPGVACHNLYIQYNTQRQLQATCVFGSLDEHDEYFHFMVEAEKMPVGTEVRIKCGNPQCSLDWKGTLPKPDQHEHQVTGFDDVVPGKFEDSLTLVVTPPSGQSFQPGASLRLSYYGIPGHNNTHLHAKVARMTPIVRELPSGERKTESLLLMPVGACTIVVR